MMKKQPRGKAASSFTCPQQGWQVNDKSNPKPNKTLNPNRLLPHLRIVLVRPLSKGEGDRG